MMSCQQLFPVFLHRLDDGLEFVKLFNKLLGNLKDCIITSDQLNLVAVLFVWYNILRISFFERSI